MTVKWKTKYGVPKRVMIADDLGLSLLQGEYDPDLLAIGIKAPRLTKKQKWINNGRANAVVRNKFNISDAEREKRRDRMRFTRTVAGKVVRREVSAILQRYRSLGEYRR